MVERRKIRVKMSLTNLMEFKKEVLVKALDEATADSRSIIVDKNGVVSRGRREMLHLSPASRAVAEKFLKDK